MSAIEWLNPLRGYLRKPSFLEGMRTENRQQHVDEQTTVLALWLRDSPSQPVRLSGRDHSRQRLGNQSHCVGFETASNTASRQSESNKICVHIHTYIYLYIYKYIHRFYATILIHMLHGPYFGPQKGQELVNQAPKINTKTTTKPY